MGRESQISVVNKARNRATHPELTSLGVPPSPGIVVVHVLALCRTTSDVRNAAAHARTKFKYCSNNCHNVQLLIASTNL